MKSDQSIKQLTTKQFVDPITGEMNIHYYWKRNKIQKVEITGKLPNKLSGLSLIKKDLDNALKWVQQARKLASENSDDSSEKGYKPSGDREIFDQVKAFFVASLTFYGK
ncbi:TPA: hypothetical protein RSW55_004344, partial [Vibrio vulnificus]|nr:hypothetical protein [Vibrio vulnificus]